MMLDPRYINRPIQDDAELEMFVQFVREQGVRRYLEVGAKYGGSLWHVVNAMPKGSIAVAVDLPFTSTFKRPVSEPYLQQTVSMLRQSGYDAHLVLGDSTSFEVINTVRKHAPYDLCFIDANHSEPFVRTDWANYGPMAKIVAFHDISFDMSRNEGKLMPIDVPKVWNEIKADFRHREIRASKKRENGFGILWR
jgi:cephalosporin hydroxylase